MKIINKLFLLLLVPVFLACNPEDQDHLKIPEPGTGGTVDIIFDSGFDNYNAADLNQALSWKLVGHDGADGSLINSVEIFVYHTSVSGVVSDTATWMIFDGELLAGQTPIGELIALIQDLSSTDDISAGDTFNFFLNEIVMDNGDVFTLANTSDGLLTNRADFAWTVFVKCPSWDEPDAIGSYLIVNDGFAPPTVSLTPGTPIQAVAGPNEGDITFIDMFGHGLDVIVSTDPSTSIATVAEQTAFDTDAIGLGFGPANIAGTGFFFTCAGLLTIDVEVTVAAGSFGTSNFQLQKQ